MLCRCKKCLEKIDGTLSNVYSHLKVKHDLYVCTIHDAEQHICFPWNDDAAAYDILIPERIKDLARKLQYQKFFGGSYKCPCCHKKVSDGFEFILNEKTKYLVCSDCIHLEIGVLVGDVVTVEDFYNGTTNSINIQQKTNSKNTLTATPNSPIGKGIIGKKIGETVEIETPQRKFRLRIISIR